MTSKTIAKKTLPPSTHVTLSPYRLNVVSVVLRSRMLLTLRPPSAPSLQPAHTSITRKVFASAPPQPSHSCLNMPATPSHLATTMWSVPSCARARPLPRGFLLQFQKSLHNHARYCCKRRHRSGKLKAKTTDGTGKGRLLTRKCQVQQGAVALQHDPDCTSAVDTHRSVD